METQLSTEPLLQDGRRAEDSVQRPPVPQNMRSTPEPDEDSQTKRKSNSPHVRFS